VDVWNARHLLVSSPVSSNLSRRSPASARFFPVGSSCCDSGKQLSHSQRHPGALRLARTLYGRPDFGRSIGLFEQIARLCDSGRFLL